MNKINLTINKKKITFRLGLGVIGEVTNTFGIKQEDVINNCASNAFYYVPRIMYCSRKYNSIRNGEVFEQDYNGFLDEMEKDKYFYTKPLVQFLEAFINSVNVDLPNDDVDSKKK